MTEQEYQLFCAARRIADIVFELKGNRFLIDNRSEDVNPHHDQTESGLFLEMYYNVPNKLWTPWGAWNFGNSGDGNQLREIHETLLKRLGAITHKRKQIGYGESEPVYALHSVDGEPLPEPKPRELAAYLPHEAMERMWEEMTVRYETEKMK